MGELCTGGDLLRAKSAPASYYVDPANNIYCVDPANNILYSNLGIDISTITFKTGNTLKYWKIFRK